MITREEFVDCCTSVGFIISKYGTDDHGTNILLDEDFGDIASWWKMSPWSSDSQTAIAEVHMTPDGKLEKNSEHVGAWKFVNTVDELRDAIQDILIATKQYRKSKRLKAIDNL